MKNVEIAITATQTQADGSRKRVPTGVKLAVPVWTIEEMKAHSESAYQWAEKALESAILAAARNAGEQSKVAADILTLITPATREGGAEALKLHRAFVNSLVAYLKTTGRKAGVLAIWSSMASSSAAVATATQAARDGLLKQLTDYAEQLSAEDAAQFEGNINKLAAQLSGADDVDESDFE